MAFSEHLCPRGLRGHSGQGRRPFFGPKVSLDAGVTCVSALPEGPGTSLISRRQPAEQQLTEALCRWPAEAETSSEGLGGDTHDGPVLPEWTWPMTRGG